MKDVASIVSSKTAVNIFLAVYCGLFFLGLLGVFMLPKEEVSLRKVAIGMSYFFGLPVVCVGGLHFLRKAGIWNGK